VTIAEPEALGRVDIGVPGPSVNARAIGSGLRRCPTTPREVVELTGERRGLLSRSSCSRQQMQPFERSTILPHRSPRATSSASTFTSPMPFRMTAIRLSPGFASRWFTIVVFPAPRYPLRTVTGIRSSPCVTVRRAISMKRSIGEMRYHPSVKAAAGRLLHHAPQSPPRDRGAVSTASLAGCPTPLWARFLFVDGAEVTLRRASPSGDGCSTARGTVTAST